MENPLLKDIHNFTNVNNLKTSETDSKAYVPTNDQDELTGILDIVLNSISVNLDAQRKSGRIRQEEYANTYAVLCQTAIQTVMQYFLQRDKILVEIEREKKQIELLDRQKKGFDEDYVIKAAETLYQMYLSFLSTLPNLDKQPYPSFATGFYHLNFQDENVYTDEGSIDIEAPKKLTALDGITGLIINTLSKYQGMETPPIDLTEVNTP